MKRLMYMTANADFYELISYNTKTAICKTVERFDEFGNALPVRKYMLYDYPSITSKKHLITWIKDYHYSDVEPLQRALKYSRKRKLQYIILITNGYSYSFTCFDSHDFAISNGFEL